MARIVGVEIPNEKKLEIALTYIYGIGLTTSKKILAATNVDGAKRTKDLSNDEINRLYEYIDKNVPTEGQVRQKIFRNIKREKDIKSFRGNRHKRGLPVRGQNTRSNSRTRKGKGRAVGGLSKKAVAPK